MPVAPKYVPASVRSAERQFTDREDLIAAFRRVLAEHRPDTNTVLVYYGVGGIGKTSLRRELQRLIDDRSDVVSAALDFDVAGCRDRETALFALRREFLKRYKAGFPTFDVAYTAYWQKSRPQSPVTSETLSLLNDGIVLSDIITLGGAVPIVGLIPRLPFLVVHGRQMLRDWWTRRGHSELRGLVGMEALEIANRLPMFWAADLRDFLNQKHKTAVVFLDTYDALTEVERVEGKAREREAWVRELAAQLPEAVWVVCGREQLRWAEADKEWAGALQQHLLGGLSENDARRFLHSCGIDDSAVQGAIVTGSQGVPYFLDLAVDTWAEIKGRHNRAPQPDDFAHTRLEVFDRFLRHLTQPEVETLKVLSAPRFWDYELFKALVTEYHTGFPLTAFADLCRFSFIDQDRASGHWRMHQLMRQSLQEHQAPELKEQVHLFLFDYYAQQLKEIAPDNVTEAHILAFAEASHHGSLAAEPESFTEWCNSVLVNIERTGRWQQLQLSLTRERYQSLVARLGPNHPVAVRTLGYLAACEVKLGDLRSAEPLLQEALARGEKVLGEDSIPYVRILVRLAILFCNQARFSEAEPLLARAVATLRSMTKPDRILLANALATLAGVCCLRARYRDADALFCEAIAILRAVAESDRMGSLGSVEIALSEALLNYGDFCQKQDRLPEAEHLFREALETAVRAPAPDNIVASRLDALGGHLLRTGRYSDAEPFLRRALALEESMVGPDDLNLARGPLDRVAELCRLQGHLAESEQLHQRSLAIIENALGPEHQDVAFPLYGLAEIRLAQCKYNEAEAFYRRALAIGDRSLGPEHPETARVLDGLARLYEQTGRTVEAHAIRQRLQAARQARPLDQ